MWPIVGVVGVHVCACVCVCTVLVWWCLRPFWVPLQRCGLGLLSFFSLTRQWTGGRRGRDCDFADGALGVGRRGRCRLPYFWLCCRPSGPFSQVGGGLVSPPVTGTRSVVGPCAHYTRSDTRSHPSLKLAPLCHFCGSALLNLSVGIVRRACLPSGGCGRSQLGGAPAGGHGPMGVGLRKLLPCGHREDCSASRHCMAALPAHWPSSRVAGEYQQLASKLGTATLSYRACFFPHPLPNSCGAPTLPLCGPPPRRKRGGYRAVARKSLLPH